MRRVSLFALATMLALAGVASAAENVVTKVTARADGGKTVIVVHGSATPSFTAYRLERPARVVVDVADGKLGADELRAGPIDVDTWAVGQIAMAQYASDAQPHGARDDRLQAAVELRRQGGRARSGDHRDAGRADAGRRGGGGERRIGQDR